MEQNFPITVELRKGSWEASVFQALADAAQNIPDTLKDPNTLIKVGEFVWKLFRWAKNRKLKPTGIGQEAAQYKAEKVLKEKYKLNCRFHEQSTLYSDKYRFVFQCGEIQKTVLVDKTNGDIDVYHGNELTTLQKDIRPSKQIIVKQTDRPRDTS